MAGQDQETYWTVVAIPDTQFYAASTDLASYATDQTDWIVDNLDSESIQFVTHEGDLVDDGGSEQEWDRIDATMSTLDGAVPYSVLPGNHDWAVTNDKSSSTANYTEYFGQSRFEDRSWYGGAGPGDDGRNSYQLFSAGGYDFLHLALEWEPAGTASEPSTPLGWAQSIIDEYPDRPTIVTTHSYLRDDGGRTSSVQDRSDDANTGEAVWQELIEPNPQIFMVLNGHWHETDGENHQVSTNRADLPVYEIVADYQDRANGGNGWVRLLQFVPGGGREAADRIRVRSYSPSLDEYETDSDSEFTFDLDFDSRFSSREDGSEQISFQQGSDGYSGTVDTTLAEAEPNQSFNTAGGVTVDTQEPHSTDNRTQALLRFNDIIGNDDGQVSPGTTIESATLTVETTDEGDGGVGHRMLTDWNGEDTWVSLDGGIEPDGNEATTDPEFETGEISTGTTSIDVTQSVQQWINGEPNYGWAVLPLGDNGWDFATSNSDTPPKLTISYDPDADNSSDQSERISLQQGSDGYSATVDTNLRENEPEQSFSTAESVTIDTQDPHSTNNEAQALIRFDNLIGDGGQQLPPDAIVEDATLTVETINDGDGGAVHRILTDWSGEDTWTSLDGGIQADGNEATTDPEFETGEVPEGSTSIDVTRSVQQWADGAQNDGWAVLPLGDDGWDFMTSNSDTPPQLTVSYVSEKQQSEQ
ncbi:DNRLRE domain-containing protein [Halovenus amylolytica]|uniref:DNRLRE domain-containing protein n=1 Tax=Halovenus amylolytica TaxID=2500550 RepID=UPI003D6ABF9F